MKHPSYFVSCNCKHEYQDEQYGKQRRVTTPVNKSTTAGVVKEVRCTVCNVTHNRFSVR